MNLFDSKGVLLTGLGFYLRGSGSGSTYGAQARVLLTGLGLVNSTCPIALTYGFYVKDRWIFLKTVIQFFLVFTIPMKSRMSRSWSCFYGLLNNEVDVKRFFDASNTP